MKAAPARGVGTKVGLLFGAGLSTLLRWRFASLFSGGGGELVGFIAVVAAVPAVLALLLGTAFGRIGTALGSGLVAAVIAAGFALFDLASPTAASVASLALLSGALTTWIGTRRWLEGRRATIGCCAAALVLLLAGAAAPKPPVVTSSSTADNSKGHEKIFVFGLDAGTWTILDEFFAKDELTNLRRLKEEGTSGILKSERFSASPRVWTTIASGKRPEKHGVLDFQCTQNQSLNVRRIWEILESKGWTVGLFQWLITWPPDPFDPFIVPAWMARGPETRPAELSFIKEIELGFQNGDIPALFEQRKGESRWQWLGRDETKKGLLKVRECLRGYLKHGLRLKTALKIVGIALGDMRDPRWELQYAAKRTIQLLLNGDVYLELYRQRQPDFSCFICYGTDNLAHILWQYHFPDDFGIAHEKAAPFANLLTNYYKAADALLGEILPLLPAETTIAVLSDHGFCSAGEGGNSHQREERPKMQKIADLLGLAENEVSKSTVATFGHFRPLSSDAAAVQAIREKIFAFLNACTRTDGSQKIFSASSDASGMIEVAINRDANCESDTRVTTPSGEFSFGDLVDIVDRTGNHSVDGIVILHGPKIRRGLHLQGAELPDVTPTLLYLEGLPMGADMDGKVLFDAIDPKFRDEHELEKIPSWDDLVQVTRDKSIQGDDRAMRSYTAALGYTTEGDQSSPPKPPKPPNDPPNKKKDER